jgi:hypothetical protein
VVNPLIREIKTGNGKVPNQSGQDEKSLSQTLLFRFAVKEADKQPDCCHDHAKVEYKPRNSFLSKDPEVIIVW